MNLVKGATVIHGNRQVLIELVEFIEHWHGEDIWLVRDLIEEGRTHLENFSKNDVIAFAAKGKAA